MDAVVHRNEDSVVVLERMSVYPNGFIVHVIGIRNPHQPPPAEAPRYRGDVRQPPRIGVRFADGRAGGRSIMKHLPKDGDGLPTEPYVRGMLGSGTARGWPLQTRVFPLPPDGPLEIFVSVPAMGLEEASTTVHGSVVRDAADRAIVIWS